MDPKVVNVYNPELINDENATVTAFEREPDFLQLCGTASCQKI